jgi:hypothetical protein
MHAKISPCAPHEILSDPADSVPAAHGISECHGASEIAGRREEPWRDRARLIFFDRLGVGIDTKPL